MADIIDFSSRTLRTPIEYTEVYQKAYGLALAIHKVTLGFPAAEQTELADDIRRAVRAICEHLIEGFEKQKTPGPGFYADVDILSMVAIDAARKIHFLLGYASDLGYIESEQCKRWQADYADLLHMLQNMQETAEDKLFEETGLYTE